MLEWAPQMAPTNTSVLRKVTVASCFSWRVSKISNLVWPRLLSNWYLYTKSQSIRFCRNPLRVEPVFPTTLWLSLIQAPFKARRSRGSSSQCRAPNLENVMWGLVPLFLGENLCNCDYPPICGSPIWVLTPLYLHPSYLSHCGSFFIALVVENLFCLSSVHSHQ